MPTEFAFYQPLKRLEIYFAPNGVAIDARDALLSHSSMQIRYVYQLIQHAKLPTIEQELALAATMVIS